MGGIKTPEFDPKTWHHVEPFGLANDAVYSMRFMPRLVDVQGKTVWAVDAENRKLADIRIEPWEYQGNTNWNIAGNAYVIVDEAMKTFTVVPLRVGTAEKNGGASRSLKLIYDLFPNFTGADPQVDPNELARVVALTCKDIWMKAVIQQKDAQDGNTYTTIRYINGWPKEAKWTFGRGGNAAASAPANDNGECPF